MTIEEFIKDLEALKDVFGNLNVRFAIGPGQEGVILSTYTDDSDNLWYDLGEPYDE